MIISIILLVVLLGVSIYINYNLLKRNESLEETYEQLADEYEEILNKMIQFEKVIESANKKLKDIDYKGSFESDDEVGFFFKELKGIQQDINNFLQ
jgi:peptidoglycan hydrolase CwlO-like protein